MAFLDLDDTEQPMDPKLVLAIESAFRFVSLTAVEFVPAPRAWHRPGGSVAGPKGRRKAQIKIDLAKRDGARCAYCTREFLDLDDATLDHVIPNSVVRHWQPWNLLLACGACNNAKADKIPLALVPMLFALMHRTVPLIQYRRRIRRAATKAKSNQPIGSPQKPPVKHLRGAYQRRQRFYRAMRALDGPRVHLAIEAAPTRLALLAGEGEA